jgi:hypothetical protein
MSIQHLLPTDGLPSTGYPAGAELEWLSGDDADGYRARGGHPVYGERDVVYRFNRFGYRGPEFDADAEVRIVAIGCSYVLGVGVAQSHLFHERIAFGIQTELSKAVVAWNLGRAGASNDYICRLLHLAVPRLDPHLVLINFTHTVRREYISVQNRHVNYNPGFQPADDVLNDIFGHFAALTSPYNDQLNFYKNYKAIELLLAGRCWLYSAINPREIEPVADHTDRSRFVGAFRAVDRARDGGHPGPGSHEALSALYWEKLVATGAIESLKGLRPPILGASEDIPRADRSPLSRA